MSNSMIMTQIQNWLDTVSFKDFSETINRRVIGQPELDMVLSNTYNYLESVSEGRPINNNMIIAAPSGSGKTETYRALKDYFADHIPAMPVYIYDISQITASGYRGSEPYEICSPFFATGTYRAIGLCFLDELDKKLTPSINASGQDTNFEAQSNLLTIIEGSDVYDRKGKVVNTESLMFIGLGSFDSFRKKREEKVTAIGFGAEANSTVEDHYDPISRVDMVKAGGSNELLGRFPFVINYGKLTTDAVDKIIEKTATKLCDSYDCELNFADDFMDELYEEANSEFGCRALESMIRMNILKAYTAALKTPEKTKQLVIKIENKNSSSFSWRKYTKQELEQMSLYTKYLEQKKNQETYDEFSGTSLDDDIIFPWDD